MQRRAAIPEVYQLLRQSVAMARIVLAWLLLLFLAGCASYGSIANKPLVDNAPSVEYSINHSLASTRSSDMTLVLAFSGGGTRAAALAYGVLAALRDTSVELNGRSRRLLDEIDVISSVSGGSFTAAYYGLYGDGLFEDFADDFLHRNVAGELLYGLLKPTLWFSSTGRTEMATRFYESILFQGATFADLERRNGPLVIINATDLGSGVRFSFLQEYFDLLCSDLSSFPLARAVTASSAVPVLFNPVVLKNHSGCEPSAGGLLGGLPEPGSAQLSLLVDGLRSYSDKERRRYIHLVDGGITDNLGLLAFHDMIEVAGGVKDFLGRHGAKISPRLMVVTVNASTTPEYRIEATNEIPSLENIVNAVTDVQLHRGNTATLERSRESVKRWAAELSTPDRKVEPYFVEIGFNSIPKKKRRFFFNQIPTGFSLGRDQVDDLIAVGRELLLGNSEFQRFLSDAKIYSGAVLR
ncbi:MAG: hypothetical protein C0623_04150 [Desulfuromonas sp.]|nr:MAG: hypothetical protein C0623_04150 [Desulfuromonas sp.]